MALIGVTTTNGTDYVASVEATTGIVTTVGNGFISTFGAGDVTAGGGDVYISASNGTLTTLNDLTGQVVEAVSSLPTPLAYDSSDGTLYGISDLNGGTLTQNLTVVDASTGVQSNIGSGYGYRYEGFYPGLTADNGSTYALSSTREYSLDLLKFNETTGTETSFQVDENGSTVEGVSSIAIDPTNGLLFGLAEVLTSSTTLDIIEIDTNTGVETLIGNAINIAYADIVAGTASATNGTYNFVANDAEGNEHIYSVSETTGAVLSDPALSANLSYLGSNGVACCCPGTLILTDIGDQPVESLAIGDVVVTATGEHRPIKWIGHRSYTGRFLAANANVQPIRISAGSLGDGLPRRDLLVSPEHAMFLDGLLIPARCLVNGSTIMRERGLKRVDYFHVELDTHDVLLAEGAPSESFLDDDSRGVFHNEAEFAALYPDTPAGGRFCAPKVDEGYEVEAIRRRVAVVAGEIAQAA